jgi:copper chaperone CopZ
MQTETMNVTGMTCGGCVGKVTRALTALPGCRASGCITAWQSYSCLRRKAHIVGEAAFGREERRLRRRRWCRKHHRSDQGRMLRLIF